MELNIGYRVLCADETGYTIPDILASHKKGFGQTGGLAGVFGEAVGIDLVGVDLGDRGTADDDFDFVPQTGVGDGFDGRPQAGHGGGHSPIIFVFFFVQRYIVEGVKVTEVKG